MEAAADALDQLAVGCRLSHAATAERLWPQLKGVAWTHGWNSRLAITRIIIRMCTSPREKLLISLGCNGRGVALSTAMGAQLARG
jgi:hypothetical protein